MSLRSLILSSMFACLLSIFAAPCAFAHPHVFVDAKVSLVFDEKGLTGFEEEWIFDEMFGKMIIDDYDKDKNGVFDEKEAVKVKLEAFENVKEWDYFHEISIQGKKFKVQWVKDFKVKIVKGLLIYTFFIPCHVPLDSQNKKINFSLSDPTIYTDLIFTKDSPYYKGNKDLYSLSHKLDDGVQPSGQVLAQTLKIQLKRK